MKRRRRMMLNDEGTENFWPSFTDLTSTIALILFVLVLLAYIQNLISEKKVSNVRSQLSLTLERLDAMRSEVKKSQAQLQRLAKQIAAGQAQLQLSEEKVAEQQEAIAQSNEELEALRSQLQGIAVLRLDVLQKVKSSIEEQLSTTKGKNGEPLVLIAENGNIVINESLVFEYNSHTIKKAGKPFLATLATGFANVLDEAGVRENIDAIMVQGHTDERGSVSYNRELSAKRANAVLNYMFEANPALGEKYGSYFASSAFSEFRPLNTKESEEAYEQNRRIEISVVLKDANIRGIIDEYMENLNPAFKTPR